MATLPTTESIRATHLRHVQRRRIWLIIGLVGLVLACLLDVSTGPAEVSTGDVIQTLLWPESAGTQLHTIIWSLRVPVALMAVLIGGTLGAAGAEMQTVLNNPLASPYTLGISAAASFGAALAMVFGSAATSIAMHTLVPASAFAWALANCGIILWIGKLKQGSIESIVLCGVALLFLFHSGVAGLQYLATENTLQAIVFWTFGSVQSATWPRLVILLSLLCVVLPLLLAQSWKLTAMRLGEDHARSLGVDVKNVRLLTLILVSVMTAAAVCFSGAIGFVGLVAPHLARMVVGEDHRFFLPVSTLFGGILLSLASTASKMLIPGAVLPLGIVTSFVGVPIFFIMVLSQKRNYW